MKDLDDADAKVRCNAALVLGRRCLCRDSGDNRLPVDNVVSKLVEHLTDRDVEVRGCAARGLSYIGTKAELAVLALVDLVKKNDEASGAALAAVAAIGPAAAEAFPQLVKASASESTDMRVLSLQALRQVAPRDPRTVEVLVKKLKDPSPSVRAEAAYGLGLLGPRAVIALPSLRETVKDVNGNVADAAKEACGRIEGNEKGN